MKRNATITCHGTSFVVEMDNGWRTVLGPASQVCPVGPRGGQRPSYFSRVIKRMERHGLRVGESCRCHCTGGGWNSAGP